MRIVSVVLLALLSFNASADTNERLAAVGKVWGIVKFAHPAMGYADVDWDRAGVEAVDKLLGGGDTRAYEAAASEMLAAIGDPMTRVVPDCKATQTISSSTRWIDSATLLLAPSVDPTVDPTAALRQARRVIVDLRASVCSPDPMPEALQRLLIRSAIDLPSERRIRHSGYKSQIGDSVYSSAFVTVDGAEIKPDPSSNVERVVFLVNERSNVPLIALALQRAGLGAILSVGTPIEDPFASHIDVVLGEGLHAVVRTGELLPSGRSSSAAAIASVPAGAGEPEILDTAISLLGFGGRRRAVHGVGSPAPLPPYRWRTDATYDDMAYPVVAYRVLAAFRLWNIVRYFYGYKQLVDPWEPRFPQMIQMMIDARSAEEYGLALGEWMTWIPDAHSFVDPPPLHDLRGEGAPPIRLLPIGDDLVVARITDPSATAKGVHMGDVLTAIDTHPVNERIEALAKYTAAATPEGTRWWIANYVPRGAIGSLASFTFRRSNGQTYTVSLTRLPSEIIDAGPLQPMPWKILSGNIGYVDLNFLLPADLNRMFIAMAGTRALIFDLRGYPNGVLFLLGQAMNTTGSSIVAEFRVPTLTGGVLSDLQFGQDIGRSTLRYSKKTAMLIDVRAISQSEHTGLIMEAVNGTTFIGSTTNGADGEVTVFVLPGNIYGQFSGEDVRHADGRQLQRVGIHPDITVYPTIAGLSQGVDEVLDRAVAYLTQ
jgi:C-terminal processing protease CtpA/Prc